MKKLLSLLLVILLSALCLAGCTGEASTPPADQPSDSVTYSLYFADKEVQEFVTEEATLTPGDDLAKRLVEALIAGPLEEDHNALLPPEAKVNEVTFEKAKTEYGKYIAIVDFSGAIRDTAYGSGIEVMAIYSVVNTITQIKDVKYVRFTIDGKKVETLWGHADLTQTFTFKEDLSK